MRKIVACLALGLVLAEFSALAIPLHHKTRAHHKHGARRLEENRPSCKPVGAFGYFEGDPNVPTLPLVGLRGMRSAVANFEEFLGAYPTDSNFDFSSLWHVLTSLSRIHRRSAPTTKTYQDLLASAGICALPGVISGAFSRVSASIRTLNHANNDAAAVLVPRERAETALELATERLASAKHVPSSERAKLAKAVQDAQALLESATEAEQEFMRDNKPRFLGWLHRRQKMVTERERLRRAFLALSRVCSDDRAAGRDKLKFIQLAQEVATAVGKVVADVWAEFHEDAAFIAFMVGLSDCENPYAWD